MTSRLAFVRLTALAAAAALVPASMALADQTLKVGNVESLTGPYATAGIPNGCGIKIATDLINASGLAKGYKIELRQEDDQSKPAFAVQAASKLTGDGIKIVVGGTGSPNVLATLPIFKDAGALFTGGTSKADEVMKSGGLVVRVNSNAGQDGAAIARYLGETATNKKIAFVALKGAYSDAVLASIKSALPPGTDIPYVYMTPADVTNYQSVVTSISSDKPNVMLVALGSQTQIVAFMRQFKQAGLNIPVVVTAGLLFPGVSKAAGGAAEGAVSADIWTLATENAANTVFKGAYEKYAANHALCAGLPLDKQMALSFSQVLLVAQAITKSGSVDPKVLHKTIIESTWDLPQGKVRFAESGQAQATYTRIISKGNTVVPLK